MVKQNTSNILALGHVMQKIEITVRQINLRPYHFQTGRWLCALMQVFRSKIKIVGTNSRFDAKDLPSIHAATSNGENYGKRIWRLNFEISGPDEAEVVKALKEFEDFNLLNYPLNFSVYSDYPDTYKAAIAPLEEKFRKIIERYS